jgi:hypothetical protein
MVEKGAHKESGTGQHDALFQIIASLSTRGLSLNMSIFTLIPWMETRDGA